MANQPPDIVCTCERRHTLDKPSSGPVMHARFQECQSHRPSAMQAAGGNHWYSSDQFASATVASADCAVSAGLMVARAAAEGWKLELLPPQELESAPGQCADENCLTHRCALSQCVKPALGGSSQLHRVREAVPEAVPHTAASRLWAVGRLPRKSAHGVRCAQTISRGAVVGRARRILAVH